MNAIGGSCLGVAKSGKSISGRNSSASPTARNTIAIPHLRRHLIYNKLAAGATEAAQGPVNKGPAAGIRPARRSGLAVPGMYRAPRFCGLRYPGASMVSLVIRMKECRPPLV